jgi:hypothetical protein
MATLSVAGATTATLAIGGIAIAGIPLIGILVFLMGGPVVVALGLSGGIICMETVVNAMQNIILGITIFMNSVLGG